MARKTRSPRFKRKGGKRTVRKGRKMRSKEPKPLTVCIDGPGNICKF